MKKKRMILDGIVCFLFLFMTNMSVQYVNVVPQNEETLNVIITFSKLFDFEKEFPQSRIYHKYHIINGIAANIPTSLYGFLQGLSQIESIELNHEMYLLEGTLDWGIDQIDAEIVWGGTEDVINVQPDNYVGQGIKVAIIDTGIQYTHPDLDDNYYSGYNFANDDSDPMDDYYHDTHCAGIVAAEDSSIGVIVVAPKAQLYRVKVLDSQGSGTYSDVIAGIDWATANDMNVVSMSLEESSGTVALEQAIQNAYDNRVVIDAASGNDYAGSISYPARYPTVVAVGATDSNDNRALFSSYGPELEVSAPGVNIYSTISGSSYNTLSGTSMATPMISEIVALMLGKKPTYDFR